MEYYDINALAEITGFTTRTLRNYMNSGLLRGEKAKGVWRFSEEDVTAFFDQPAVRQSLGAKRNAMVFDFMADRWKRVNSACIILDFPVAREEAMEISDFFCRAVNECGGVSFRFHSEAQLARVILSGPEEAVMGIAMQYYGR